MAYPLGIYIHIPFCVRKCAYCDFFSVTETESRSAYIRALSEQIKSFRQDCKKHCVDTVYIGGGTPSLLSADELEEIFEALRYSFKIAPDAEITAEANPGTLDSQKSAELRSLGVNRLSLGLQSASNAELKVLSRIHTREEFENTYILSRLEGFDNINVDIMYGLPGQSLAGLEKTLSYVYSLNPEHISFYGLKIEENTPFYNNERVSSMLPGEDIQYKMYMTSAKSLEEHGYAQYEISNFARPGYACRHNLKYWNSMEYLGFGTGAHSYFNGEMFSWIKNIGAFIEAPTDRKTLIESSSRLTLKEAATQYVMLGFRLRDGVDIYKYEQLFGKNFDNGYLDAMLPFIEKKFIVRTASGYRLSRRGMLVSNYILSEILDFGK